MRLVIGMFMLTQDVCMPGTRGSAAWPAMAWYSVAGLADGHQMDPLVVVDAAAAPNVIDDVAVTVQAPLRCSSIMCSGGRKVKLIV